MKWITIRSALGKITHYHLFKGEAFVGYVAREEQGTWKAFCNNGKSFSGLKLKLAKQKAEELAEVPPSKKK